MLRKRGVHFSLMADSRKKLLSVFLSCFKVEALYWGRNKKTKEEHDGQLSDDIYAL